MKPRTNSEILGRFLWSRFSDFVWVSPFVSRSALGIPWQRRTSDACKRILKRSPSPGRGRDDWVTVETAHHARPSCEPLPKTDKKKQAARCQRILRQSLSSSSVTEEIHLLLNVLFYIWLKHKYISPSGFRKYKSRSRLNFFFFYRLLSQIIC